LGEIRALRRKLALNIRIQDHFVCRERGRIRSEQDVLHLAAVAEGNWESDERDIRTKSEKRLGETVRVVIHALLIALVIEPSCSTVSTSLGIDEGQRFWSATICSSRNIPMATATIPYRVVAMLSNRSVAAGC